MARRKKQDEEPEQDYMDGQEPPEPEERLGADADADEIIRAQAAALDKGNVLITLGIYSVVSGKERYILAKFACVNRPDFVSLLGVMQPNYVGIFEPERGTRRKAIVNVTGEITKFMTVGGKKKHVTVWIKFDSTATVQAALAQIDECNPPTAVLFATGDEIPGVDGSDID
jgi:hypothetical protein